MLQLQPSLPEQTGAKLSGKEDRRSNIGRKEEDGSKGKINPPQKTAFHPLWTKNQGEKTTTPG